MKGTGVANVLSWPLCIYCIEKDEKYCNYWKKSCRELKSNVKPILPRSQFIDGAKKQSTQ